MGVWRCCDDDEIDGWVGKERVRGGVDGDVGVVCCCADAGGVAGCVGIALDDCVQLEVGGEREDEGDVEDAG